MSIETYATHNQNGDVLPDQGEVVDVVYLTDGTPVSPTDERYLFQIGAPVEEEIAEPVLPQDMPHNSIPYLVWRAEQNALREAARARGAQATEKTVSVVVPTIVEHESAHASLGGAIPDRRSLTEEYRRDVRGL